jgi:hypothetical protein
MGSGWRIARQARDPIEVSVVADENRDLEIRRLQGVAFCFNSRVRFADSPDKVPAVEVEVHYKGLPATIWHFLYQMDAGKAKVLEYYTNEAKENLFDPR